jgi:hypothetical protein
VAAEVPSWRRVFDAVERTIGEPLERIAADRRFSEALLVGLEISNALAGMGRRASSQAFHMVNLPTHSDIRRLERRLGAVEGQLVAIAAALERLEKAEGKEPWPPSRSRPKRSTPSAPRSTATPGERGTD